MDVLHYVHNWHGEIPDEQWLPKDIDTIAQRRRHNSSLPINTGEIENRSDDSLAQRWYLPFRNNGRQAWLFRVPRTPGCRLVRTAAPRMLSVLRSRLGPRSWCDRRCPPTGCSVLCRGELSSGSALHENNRSTWPNTRAKRNYTAAKQIGRVLNLKFSWQRGRMLERKAVEKFARQARRSKLDYRDDIPLVWENWFLEVC